MFIKMKEYQTVIFFILLKGFSSVDAIPVSSISCGDFCSATPGSPYMLTCTYSGTPIGIVWARDGNTVLTCDATGTTCFPLGHSTGSYPNSTSAMITITSFDSSTDSGIWQCNDGADAPVSCTLPDVATGSLLGQCNETGNSNEYNISCSGITSHGSPAASLQLQDGNTGLASTTSAGSVSTTQTDAGRKTYTCEVTGAAATCLSPTSVSVTCPAPSPGTTLPPTKSPETTSCDCLPCLIIAAILAGLVIIFILLLCCYGSNRAADSENAGGKCFRCRKDNHRAKTCKAPDNGSEYRKNREKTLPDLDDKTIEMNLKKDLEAMKQSETDVKQKYVIDMKLGTITVNNKEYAQFIITKKQSQVEICLYWKEERMEWHQLIYKTNQSNRAAVEGCCSDPWRLALFIGSIGLIITSLGCLIYPLAGCLPLEGQCVGSVVVSGLGIPLGIVGLLLCFCWRIDGYSWLCSCCNRGNKNSDTEMTGQSTPLSNSSNRDLRL